MATAARASNRPRRSAPLSPAVADASASQSDSKAKSRSEGKTEARQDAADRGRNTHANPQCQGNGRIGERPRASMIPSDSFNGRSCRTSGPNAEANRSFPCRRSADPGRNIRVPQEDSVATTGPSCGRPRVTVAGVCSISRRIVRSAHYDHQAVTSSSRFGSRCVIAAAISSKQAAYSRGPMPIGSLMSRPSGMSVWVVAASSGA